MNLTKPIDCAIDLLARGVVAALLLGSNAAAATPPQQGDTYASIAKLPDWSGYWAFFRDGIILPPGTKPPGPLPDGRGVRTGGPMGEPMFLTPKYAAIAADHARRRAQENLSYCLPAGVPGVLQHRIIYEFLFTPGRVTMMFEDGEVRRIYTDGRKHVPLADQTTSFMGDSIGHWEGNTLVVDTIGFPNGTLWQNYGVLATIKSHLVERIYRKDADHMEIDNVLTDPDIFARPYVYKRLYERSVIPITEAECLAGNRDTGTSVDLTPPPLGS